MFKVFKIFMIFIYSRVKTARGSTVSVGAATPAILMAIFLFLLPQVQTTLSIKYSFLMRISSITGFPGV